MTREDRRMADSEWDRGYEQGIEEVVKSVARGLEGMIAALERDRAQKLRQEVRLILNRERKP